MLTRKMQGWPMEAIAEEAGISQRAASAALTKLKRDMPNLLQKDAIEVATNLVEQYEASIAASEMLARDYATTNPNAAIGARRAADASRRDLVTLLQGLGKLPHELGTMRHLVDLRATIRLVVDVVDQFVVRVEEAKLPPRQRTPLLKAATEARATLREFASG